MRCNGACSHVLEIISDPRPSVRGAAIEALGHAVVGTLANLRLLDATAVLSTPGEQPGSDSTGGVEHMLLVALEALYTADSERDVRLGVLQVLTGVLQV